MECDACERVDSNLKFFCETCLENRLAEHLTRKTQLSQTLSHVTSRALSLLSPPPSSPLLGVLEERQLKATKFSLGTRLRDVRVAIAKGKEDIEEGKKEVEERTRSIKERRERLGKAKEMDRELAVRVIGSEETEDVYDRHYHLYHEKASTDLAAAFSISPSAPPPTSPFSSSPFSAEEGLSSSIPIASTSTLHSHLIPTPSSLSISPPPLPSQTLSFVLTQLLYLVRLVALYNRVLLPFEVDTRNYGGIPGCAGLLPSAAWAGVLKIPTSKSAFPVDSYASTSASTSKSPPAVIAPPASITHVPSSPTPSKSSTSPTTSKTKSSSKSTPSSLRHGAVALAYNFAYCVWFLGFVDDVTIHDVDSLARNVEWVVFGKLQDELEVASTSKRKPRRDTTTDIFPLSFDLVYEHFFGRRPVAVAGSTVLSGSGETGKGKNDPLGEDDEEGWDLV